MSLPAAEEAGTAEIPGLRLKFYMSGGGFFQEDNCEHNADFILRPVQLLRRTNHASAILESPGVFVNNSDPGASPQTQRIKMSMRMNPNKEMRGRSIMNIFIHQPLRCIVYIKKARYKEVIRIHSFLKAVDFASSFPRLRQ